GLSLLSPLTVLLRGWPGVDLTSGLGAEPAASGASRMDASWGALLGVDAPRDKGAALFASTESSPRQEGPADVPPAPVTPGRPLDETRDPLGNDWINAVGALLGSPRRGGASDLGRGTAGGAGQAAGGGFASPAPMGPPGRSSPTSSGLGRGATAGNQFTPDQLPGLPGAAPTAAGRGGRNLLRGPSAPDGGVGTPQAGLALSPSSGSDPSSPPPPMGPQSECGSHRQYSIPIPDSRPAWITAGPDGNLWFTA